MTSKFKLRALVDGISLSLSDLLDDASPQEREAFRQLVDPETIYSQLASRTLDGPGREVDCPAPLLILDGQYRVRALPPLETLCQRSGRGPDREHLQTTRERVRSSAAVMREARAPSERREAVREFLAAVAELILCVLRFLVAVLLGLLSRSLSQTDVTARSVPKPAPSERTPQITPRGPNSAFPVSTYRGGHRSSALGSVVLAA